MGFFRKEIIEFALDQETRRAMEEQAARVAAEPLNPVPYYQLALLCRMQSKQDQALGLLLEAIRLDPAFALAHGALAEIYAVRNDATAARRHAELAAANGNAQALALLERYVQR